MGDIHLCSCTIIALSFNLGSNYCSCLFSECLWKRSAKIKTIVLIYEGPLDSIHLLVVISFMEQSITNKTRQLVNTALLYSYSVLSLLWSTLQVISSWHISFVRFISAQILDPLVTLSCVLQMTALYFSSIPEYLVFHCDVLTTLSNSISKSNIGDETETRTFCDSCRNWHVSRRFKGLIKKLSFYS